MGLPPGDLELGQGWESTRKQAAAVEEGMAGQETGGQSPGWASPSCEGLTGGKEEELRGHLPSREGAGSPASAQAELRLS